MTYEQLENLFSPIYALLGLILITTALIGLVKMFEYIDQTKNAQDKQKIKDLEERIKTKTEMERLRYEHEQLIKKMKEDEEK